MSLVVGADISPVDELVDVVDEHDRVVATVGRAEMRARRLRHRAVFVAVLSTCGELLVHRRSAAKDVWPSRYDLAVGGVVVSEESYEDAARRELAEEIGLAGVEPVSVGTGAFADGDVDLVGHVYLLTHDGPFHFADGEVAWAAFVDRAELRRLLATEAFVPDSVALVLPLVEQEMR
jgi:isopentenyldiphosphate isomerase